MENGKETKSKKRTGRKKSEDPRFRRVNLSFTADEFQTLKMMADDHNMQVGAMIRRIVMKGSVAKNSDGKRLEKLIANLGKVGSNINQLARHANAGRLPSEENLEITLRELAELRTEISEALAKTRG